MIKNWTNKMALAGVAMVSAYSSSAFAQSDPFAAFEDAGNSFLDSIDGPVAIIATIVLIVMGLMFMAGRLAWPMFVRLGFGVLLVGLAPSIINWLLSAVG